MANKKELKDEELKKVSGGIRLPDEEDIDNDSNDEDINEARENSVLGLSMNRDSASDMIRQRSTHKDSKAKEKKKREAARKKARKY